MLEAELAAVGAEAAAATVSTGAGPVWGAGREEAPPMLFCRGE